LLPAGGDLLRIRQFGGNVPVAILPSDHYVSDDALFVGAVAPAVEVVRRRPRRPLEQLRDGRLEEPAGFRIKGVEWSDWGHPQRVMAMSAG